MAITKSEADSGQPWRTPLLAKKAKDMQITKVYFDRGIYKYHGRVKAFADTLRKNGMEF